MKWGLVLSGGGARGLAHIGVLKKLESWGLRPDVLVGCSMGAVIGGIYASGTELDEMERFLLHDFAIRKVLNTWVFQFSERPLIKLVQAEDALYSLLRKNGIDNGQKILKIIRRFTHDRSFNQTRIPFACNAVDLLSGKEVMLSEDKMADAIRASMAIPGFFEPVTMNGMLLVDGGVIDNAPFWMARKMGIRKILISNVGKFETVENEEIHNTLSVIARTFTVMGKVSAEERRIGRNILEIVSYDGNHTLDFSRKEELLRLGEDTMEAHKTEILRHVGPKKWRSL